MTRNCRTARDNPVEIGDHAVVTTERNEWQRRYDESIDAERSRSRKRDPAEDGFAAILYAGCLPGLVGLVAMVITGAVVMLRRSLRRI